MVLVFAAILVLFTLQVQEEKSQATQRWQRLRPLLRQGLSQKGYGHPSAPTPPDDGEELLLVLLLLVLLLEELLLLELWVLELALVSLSEVLSESLELVLSTELLSLELLLSETKTVFFEEGGQKKDLHLKARGDSRKSFLRTAQR